MIGLIARYQTKIVFAIGPTRGYCEEIILALFEEEGLDMSGVELPVIEFDPEETGGVLIDPSELESPEGESMEGWSLDGWTDPPTQ